MAQGRAQGKKPAETAKQSLVLPALSSYPYAVVFDLPLLHCFIDNLFIRRGVPGTTEAYLFAGTALPNRPLLFTLHTIHGAVYSRLPIHALYHRPQIFLPAFSPHLLDPWSVSGSAAQGIEHRYLKDYSVEVLTLKMKGRYLFTVDFFESGTFAQDPEQHKTQNIIALENGQLGAFPNNFLRFTDKHFTVEEFPPYTRNQRYFVSPS